MATATGKAANVAAAPETASTSVRSCPRWLTKTNKPGDYYTK
jgi:hypothetical protein